MSDPITIIHDGRHVTAEQYTAATGRPAPLPRRRGSQPTAFIKPPALSADAIAEAERSRISQILSLPAARKNKAAAEGIAFGSGATVAEAAATLARHADKQASDREALKDNMRRQCGMPTAKLRPGEITGLKHVMKTGRPADREDARKRLEAAGVKL